MSHSTLSATTELQAINVMLGTIGEQPVSDLDSTGLSDVAIAKQILTEQSRRIQAKGWNFNTDRDFQLALDLNSKCPVPPNALRIEGSRGKKLVARGGFLWDRNDNTFVLDDAPYCDIVRFLPFEDMLESARYYVTLKAARVFQRRMLGDDATEVFTEKDEFEAKADFEDADADSADTNFLADAELNGFIRTGRSYRMAQDW